MLPILVLRPDTHPTATRKPTPLNLCVVLDELDGEREAVVVEAGAAAGVGGAAASHLGPANAAINSNCSAVSPSFSRK